MQKQAINLKEWEKYNFDRPDYSTVKRLIDLQERNIINTDLTEKGIEISCKSMVGFEINDSFSLIVEPKISNFSLLKMIGFIHGFIPIGSKEAIFGEGQNQLMDLVIFQWLNLVEKLIPRIRKKYVTINSYETFVKGKINFKNLASKGIISEKIPIKFKVLRLNQPLNQLIKAGLIYFKKSTSNSFLINRVDILLRSFIAINSVDLSLYELNTYILSLNRLNEVYRKPLKLLYWLLKTHGIKSKGNITGKSMWVNMNKIFQEYLTKAMFSFSEELTFMSEVSDYTVFKYSHQANPFNNSSISIRPDLLIFRGKDLKNIIDFKYKDYSNHTVSTSDLYQLSNYGLSVGKGEINPIILYPAYENVPDQIVEVKISSLNKKQLIFLRGVNLVELERLIDQRDIKKLKNYCHSLLYA